MPALIPAAPPAARPGTAEGTPSHDRVAHRAEAHRPANRTTLQLDRHSTHPQSGRRRAGIRRRAYAGRSADLVCVPVSAAHRRQRALKSIGLRRLPLQPAPPYNFTYRQTLRPSAWAAIFAVALSPNLGTCSRSSSASNSNSPGLRPAANLNLYHRTLPWVVAKT